MFVVLSEEVEQRLLLLGKDWAALGGLHLPELSACLNLEEELISVALRGQEPAYLARGGGTPVPCYAAQLGTAQIPSYLEGAAGPGGSGLLLWGVSSQETPSLQAFFFATPSAPPQVCETAVVRLDTDIFSRLKGVFDTQILSPKTVGVIGLGSGGSVGAVELAKAGVGNFILADFDRLRAHNVSRHVCGLRDVGRFKTRAVRDVILQHNPRARVQCYEIDVAQAGDLLDSIAERSDLVLVATDTELSRYLINEACLAANTPAIYGGAYERAFAGEVIRVIPGSSGCYACVRQELANTMRSMASQQEFDYTDDSELQAEPGLGLDVSFIALFQAKLALMTLLRDTQSAVGDIDADMIIWTNSARPQDGELFERPMARCFVRVPRAADCRACGVDPGAGPAAGEGSG